MLGRVAIKPLTSTTDAEGNATAYTYDANGNVLTVTDALGNSVSYTYDVRGRTAAEVDKLGAVMTYSYDVKGNVTKTTDAAGYSTVYVYDAVGNLVKTTNRMNESVSYTYDSMSRRIKEKNELNQTREYEYDEAGNLVSVTDGNRHVTTYTYDSLSRLVREENAEGAIAEYSYDYLGNIATYTVYGGGNERATTTYTYDAAGNLTKETSPLGYTTSYTYDANGNVTSRTDENGTETTYEYDPIGRLINREDRDGQVEYTYDKVGNVTTAASDAGTVSFAYDELYRTTKVTNEDGTEVTYTYDAAGNRLSITYPDGKAVTTAYDELGRVLSLTDHDGTGILYTRDAEGRVTKESYSDGSTTEYAYNAAGLLTLQKEVTGDNETLRQIAYTYDDAGNLTSENRSGVGIDHADELVRYYYDKADQLVKTNIEGVTKEYVYDKAGNLTSDGTNTYTYDLQNRLITKTSSDGTTTYSYDKAGNLISDGTTNYTYSAQNKLIKGEKTNGESSEYLYNALGVRIANIQIRENKNAKYQNSGIRDGSHGVDYMRFLKNGRASWQRVWETEIGTTVQNDKETVTRHYTVDYLSIANRDIFVTEDGSYTTRYVYDASGRRLSAEFDYAPGTKDCEAGENLQSDIAAEIGKVFYRTSILGSTLFAVDKDGNQIAHAIYDPWGKPLTETYTDSNYSGLENLNNYTGYTWDITLKLYFAQNRFYDADTHRFTQEDAAKDGANWYVYCGNAPVLRVDVWGLKYVKLKELAEKYGATISLKKERKYPWEQTWNSRIVGINITLYGERKYYTATSFDGDGAFLGTKFSMQFDPDGDTMYIDDAIFYSDFNIVYDKKSLLDSLSKSVDQYKNIWQTLATAPYNTNEEALDIVLSYNKVIECAAKKYDVDKAMIQAILFQEIRFYNILDEVDTFVLDTFRYLHDEEKYSNLSWILKAAVGLPTPPVVYRTDSSTGLGQIFAKTAIEAINWYNDSTRTDSTKYDSTNWKDLELIWKKLKYNDTYNINMVAMILAYKRSQLSGDRQSSARDIMQTYNGSGSLAVKYGEVTEKYYIAFQQYNLTTASGG